MAESCLQRIADGDASAVDEVLDRYGGLVWSLARRMCGNESDAEDAVQEVFIDVWRNAGRFDPAIASESTFITLLARRRLIDRHRRRVRLLPTASLEDEQALPMSAEQDSDVVEARTELIEEAARARKQLARLRPDERRVLELSVYHGLSQSQIAEKMKMPLGTVKTHARRGLVRLRELLSGSGATPAKGGAR